MRAACQCTALIAVIIAVTVVLVSLSDSPRRVWGHHHGGCHGRQNQANLMMVRYEISAAMLETVCMGAASVLTAHVCDLALHSSAALAYRKRRRHHTSAGRLQEVLSETEVGVRVAVGYNVELPV